MAQKEYKTRQNWLRIVIHRELHTILKFDHSNKWYMRKREPARERETNQIRWDFEIQTDLLIPARSSDLMLINKKKKKLSSCGFWRSSGSLSENKRKQCY